MVDYSNAPDVPLPAESHPELLFPMDQTSATSRDAAPGSSPRTTRAPTFREFIRFFRAAIRPWRWIYLAMFAGVLLVTAAGYVLPVVQKRLINALAGRESPAV